MESAKLEGLSIDGEQRGWKREESELISSFYTDSAASRFGCKMMRSVLDKMRLSHFSEANDELVDESTIPTLWRERMGGGSDYKAIRNRQYLKL